MLQHDDTTRRQVRPGHAKHRVQVVIIIRGIEKDKITVARATRPQKVSADHLAGRTNTAVRDVRFGDLPRPGIALVKRDVLRAAAHGLEANRSRAGKRVQNPAASHAGAEHVEQRLSQAIRSRPNVIRDRPLETTALESARDDAHSHPTSTKPNRSAQLPAR